MKKLLLGTICIVLFTGCSKSSESLYCGTLISQGNKHLYSSMYVNKGFEDIANIIEREKYQKEFNQKLNIFGLALINKTGIIKDIYANSHCVEFWNGSVIENNQTKLNEKINKVKSKWMGEYNQRISTFEFREKYIKENRCEELVVRLSEFYVNKELKKENANANFKMAKETYVKCIKTVSEFDKRK